jgi:hypothetical protein
MDDPNAPQQVLPDYQSNDANIPSYGDLPKGSAPAANPKAEPIEDTSIPLGPKESLFDTKKILGVVFGAIAGVIVLAVGIVLVMSLIVKPGENGNNGGNIGTGDDNDGKPQKIDLQLATDQWLTSQPASNNSAILIYDIDNDEIVARHNEDVAMRIESIYKMFVAYEGYYRVDHDMLDKDVVLPIANDYEDKPYTVSKCLDHMIRYSYSPCAEILANQFGWENLQASFNEQGFKNTSIHGVTSNASDILKLYQMYWKHNDLHESSWDKIQESMINQTAATDNEIYNRNWRKGLPSGFSSAKVYNKTGFLSLDGVNYNFYDDAAFIVFPEVESNKDGKKVPERHYIVIVLTKDTAPQEIVKYGRKLEEAVKTADNYK